MPDCFPEAERIIVVLDQLNTHSKASLYEAFEPKEAHRLASKLELHHTPKHGSWLNAVEIEFAALSKQCLDRRIADLALLAQEVRTWTRERNALATKLNWHFTTTDARIKLARLYSVNLN